MVSKKPRNQSSRLPLSSHRASITSEGFNSSDEFTFESAVIPNCSGDFGSAAMDSSRLRLHPIQFQAVGWAYLPELKGFLVQDNSTIFFPNVRALPGLDNSTVVSAQAGTSNLVHNMFQSLFQVLRLEMGIILPNQIYASPEMFNNSILPVSLPPQFSIPNTISMANTSRASTTNASELSQWRDMVDLFNTTDRVPVMEYTRTVPKLKPLGSAITSVFVSTFAMLSSLWTVFSLAAGALARIYAGKHRCVCIEVVSLLTDARLL
jgi:hypothetical protein